MDEEKKTKKGFNWMEFIAVTMLMLLAVVATAGITYYIMNNQMLDAEQEQADQVASYQARITALEAKNKADNVTDAVTANSALTIDMVKAGTYTLSGAKVTLVDGKATVGENIYTLDTTKVAFTTDKTKAVVVINQTTGTSTTPVNTYVVAVNNKDGKANQVAAATVASGAAVTAVTYTADGKITITTTSAVLATPTTKTYTITGTTFTEVK